MKISWMTVVNYLLLLSFGCSFLHNNKDDSHDHKKNEPIESNYNILSSSGTPDFSGYSGFKKIIGYSGYSGFPSVRAV